MNLKGNKPCIWAGVKNERRRIFSGYISDIYVFVCSWRNLFSRNTHGTLAVGAYIAMAGDECARAVGMVLRWKSGKWKSKGLVEV